MTALDVFVFLLLIGGAAIGFVRGFVHEMISLFAWDRRDRHAEAVSHAALGRPSEQLSHQPRGRRCARLRDPVRAKLPHREVARPSARRKNSPARPCSALSTGFWAAGSEVSRGSSARPCSSSSPTLPPTWSTAPRRNGRSGSTKSISYPLLNASGRAIVDWVEARRGHPPGGGGAVSVAVLFLPETGRGAMQLRLHGGGGGVQGSNPPPSAPDQVRGCHLPR